MDPINDSRIDWELVTVKPTWDKENMPLFLERTNVEYGKSLVVDLLDKRGIGNRLLSSFLLGLPDGAYIGGGFISAVLREEKNATDIDFFFTSEKAFIKTLDQFLNPEKYLDKEECWAYWGYKIAEDSNQFINALEDRSDYLATEQETKKDEYGALDNVRYVKFVHPTRPAVQLIKLAWYDSPEHVIDSFDFTVVQFICDSKYIYYNPIALMDMAKKRLVLHRMQFPASTLRRMIKYASKGFYVCPGSLINISEKIQEILNNPAFVNDMNGMVYID